MSERKIKIPKVNKKLVGKTQVERIAKALKKKGFHILSFKRDEEMVSTIVIKEVD